MSRFFYPWYAVSGGDLADLGRKQAKYTVVLPPARLSPMPDIRLTEGIKPVESFCGLFARRSAVGIDRATVILSWRAKHQDKFRWPELKQARFAVSRQRTARQYIRQNQ